MVNIVFASLFATASAGACSADEQAALADPATVGKAGSDCGLTSYNPVTGNFNHDKFKTCFMGKIAIGDACAECFAANGDYAAQNCKVACLAGWCKEGCLSCSTAAEPKAALDACTGYTSGGAEPCLETTSTDVDCTAAACPDQCTCSLDKCASQIDTCLADATCAKGQACALACPCSDTACSLKCAAANPSTKALPVATCINSQCAGKLAATDVDCTTAACPDQCACSLDKCASQIDTCLADATCAKGQACALACPCSDTACSLKCAAANPSTKALPVATCINSQCAGVLV